MSVERKGRGGAENKTRGRLGFSKLEATLSSSLLSSSLSVKEAVFKKQVKSASAKPGHGFVTPTRGQERKPPSTSALHCSTRPINSLPCNSGRATRKHALILFRGPILSRRSGPPLDHRVLFASFDLDLSARSKASGATTCHAMLRYTSRHCVRLWSTFRSRYTAPYSNVIR